jgi:hypothetical protein
MGTGSVEAEAPVIAFAEFLESSPPNVPRRLSDLAKDYGNLPYATSPDITLHCSFCDGPRTFSTENSFQLSRGKPGAFKFMAYACRNCEQDTRVFALLIVLGAAGVLSGSAMKLGQKPPFGPNIPARVISLVGEDRDLFLKGRNAESLGYGLGAFAYYRRVVENQKARIILDIGKVAAKVAGAEAENLFKAAAKETQFSKAIDMVKTAFPQSLLFKGGVNPLALLHEALSESLHGHTDGECLEWAADMRLVLTEIAERVSTSLKDEAELETSVSRLLARQAAKRAPKGEDTSK